MKEREKFGSRLGFILVSAGCAVGLGNVWKFPYICGQYGGAAFILIYIIFLLILGLPILMCEFAVGRGSGKSMSKALDVLEPAKTKWHQLKWISVIGSYLLMMFYTMVGGWMIYYAYRMATGKLTGLDTAQVKGAYEEMLASAPTMSLWMIIAVVVSFLVCALGLKNGIEKITKIMMIILILLMVVLAVNSLFLPNASKGVKFYLIPDFSLVKKHGLTTVVFAAMSHAFFTLSIGMGTMEIFGSYMKRDRTLMGESVNILIVDTFVALTAGLIIIPACFSFGVEPGSGPSLLFITLPNVFNHMANGRIWGTAFFVFMSFAALSTIIAVFENMIAFFIDAFGWSRKKAVAVNLVLILALSFPAVLGYNVFRGFEPLGSKSTIMDLEDFIVSYNLLPLGSIVFLMFCCGKKGWGFRNFIKEANVGKGWKLPGKAWLQIYMSVIMPTIIIVIYLKGYYDFFKPQGTKTLIGWMIFAVAFLALILWRVVFCKKKER